MAKKITAIVSLALVGIIVAAIIIMANIKVDHNIDYAAPNAIWVKYKTNEVSKVKSEKDKEQILEYMEKATEDKFLNAWLNMTLNKKPEVKLNKTTSVNIPSTKNYYVILAYDNMQKLQGVEDDVYYNQLVFSVSESEGEVETKVYVSEDGTMTYRYYYLIEVDYTNIFEYLNENGYQN